MKKFTSRISFFGQRQGRLSLRQIVEPCIFLIVFSTIFGLLAHYMGLSNMLNTIMQTAYHLLLETVFFLMGITVITGALGKLFIEFGIVRLLEKVLRPLMRPLFDMPGVAALGAVVTFLSDNPAIISLAKDKEFGQYFKKYQLISITNFGTAFGMGLIVIVFMAAQGFAQGATIGLVGSFIGCIVSTRLMQHLTLKAHPEYRTLPAYDLPATPTYTDASTKHESTFIRFLNAILDGGKNGVELGLAIIPGVLVISTMVMMTTFGPDADSGTYLGKAYEGVPILPWLAQKADFIFNFLFGFQHPELVSFPITALGAVGAALSLIPQFIKQGLIDNNVIAVFTAMGMCWSGYLSTHTAMLDSLGYRHLIGKAVVSHTVGGLCAGIVAHWLYVLLSSIWA